MEEMVAVEMVVVGKEEAAKAVGLVVVVTVEVMEVAVKEAEMEEVVRVEDWVGEVKVVD